MKFIIDDGKTKEQTTVGELGHNEKGRADLLPRADGMQTKTREKQRTIGLVPKVVSWNSPHTVKHVHVACRTQNKLQNTQRK